MNMNSKNKSLIVSFLKVLELHGFKAYAVGGYVRDYLLHYRNDDYDICTNATPSELKKIFNDCIIEDNYGSLKISYNSLIFEVTTFRIEGNYIDHRHPSKVIYVDNLKEDLKRRDFTINSICMDSDGKYIDFYDGINDLKHKTIKCIGNANDKLFEDSLRILRAIRLATVLKFDLADDVQEAIKNNKEYLLNLSYSRRKEELDKIFSSKNAKYGIDLIIKFGLEEYLDISGLKELNFYGNSIVIWSLINCDNYCFNKSDKKIINDVRKLLKEDKINMNMLYKYGIDSVLVYSEIKNISKLYIRFLYSLLPIHNVSDINIKASEIKKLLDCEDKEISKIYKKLEFDILNHKLKNKNVILKKYIVENFKK